MKLIIPIPSICKIKFILLVTTLFIANGIYSQNLDSLIISNKVDSLLNESRKLLDKGLYNQAKIPLLDADFYVRKHLSDSSFQYGKICYINGILSYYLSEVGQAEKNYTLAKKIFKKTKAKGYYSSCIMNLVSVKVELGKFEEAEELNNEATDIFEKSLGKKSLSYAAAISGKGYLFMEMANYEKAELAYLEAIEVYEINGGKDDRNYLQGLNNLGSIYMAIGDFSKAEKYYKKVNELRFQIFGKEHLDYVEGLNNLGVLYYDMGEYDKAESNYLEAKELTNKILGLEHYLNSDVLTNLGILYEAMGNFQKAELYYEEASSKRLSGLGKESQDFAESLSNLAGFYTVIGNNEKVEKLLIQAKEIYENIKAIETKGYTSVLTNLASFYTQKGNYLKAESSIQEALRIKEKLFGKNHFEYARGLNVLSDLYELKGDFKSSLQYNLQSLEIFERELGKQHPDYANVLSRTFRIYERNKTFDESEILMNEYSNLNIQRLTSSASFLSEKELSLYVNTFKKNAAEVLLFLVHRQNNKEKIGGLTELAYNQILFHKGFLLYAIKKLKDLVKSTPESIELNSRLNGYRRLMAEELTIETPDKNYITELEEKANKLEKELAKVTIGYYNILKQYQWQELRSSLKSGEAAIEFVNFSKQSRENSDTVIYAALILTPESDKPHFITLFDENEIKSVLSQKNQALKSELLTQIYTRGANPIESINNREGLFDLCWKPMDSLLQGIKKIYYSPIGILHQINFDAMPVGNDLIGKQITLSDKYTLARIGSTRNLIISDSVQIDTTNSISLFGGIEYELDTSMSNKDTGTIIINRSTSGFKFEYASRSVTSRGENWNFLPATETEVLQIFNIVSGVKYPITINRGINATEEIVKQLGDGKLSPRVMHFATHGFFFPDPQTSISTSFTNSKQVFRMSDHPMIRSGLLLSGSNYAWKTGRSWREDMEDGILTAYEISQLNLSNTELVVLSACETGLGDVQGNEGVYGLQRAFKIAGVKYIIMSLWQVPDKQTSLLMTTFYKKWLEEKLSIPDAFHSAQKELRDGGLEPYYWAGFVLVE